MKAAHAPQCNGGGVLAVLGGDVLDLASGDTGDHDGVADGVGWALFAFRASGHQSVTLCFSMKIFSCCSSWTVSSRSAVITAWCRNDARCSSVSISQCITRAAPRRRTSPSSEGSYLK